MTATHAAPSGFPQNLILAFQQGLRWFAKGMLAVALIMLAGLLAVMTAIAGLVLAAFALLVRISGSKADDVQTYDVREEGDAITLEARRTPRGWTVE
ncbi:MAG: hypothetical protein AAGB16_01180 [Pseudomonadota bacterium]